MPSERDNAKQSPYSTPPEDSVRKQLSLSALLAAITVLSVGFALLRAAPFLSMFSLIGLFLVASTPGMVVGYIRKRWSGCIMYGCLSGTSLIVSLVVIGTLSGHPAGVP